MTITLSILYEKLSSDYRCKKNKKYFTDNPLHSLLLYAHGPLSEDFLYVANAAELRLEELPGASIICVGEPAFDYRSIPCDLIIVESITDLKVLFNRVQMIYLSLLHWDEQLKSLSRDAMDMRLLLEEGRRELNFSFIFLNKFFKPIAISSDLGNNGLLGESSGEILASILQGGAVEDASKFSGSREFFDPAHNKKGIYFNVYYNSDYRGKLLALCDGHRTITRADHMLFENICIHVSKMYELFSISPMRTPSYVMMQQALRSVLQGGTQLSKSDVLKVLQSVDWAVNDSYMVYFIPFDEKGSISARAEYIVTLLENRWNSTRTGSTRGTVLGDGIAWTVNLSRPVEVDFDDFLPDFIALVKTLNGQVGASAICHDFFSLQAYLKQAAIAIQFGIREEPDTTLFPFGKYSLDYMLDSAAGGFTVENVVHPSLLTLMDYDRENNTEFCKTLRVFIRCKYNVLQASSELFIHRSTFSVRIKRIEALCHIDLDDERTRLHILMSFYILEKAGLSHY